jgi:hypothetical protein
MRVRPRSLCFLVSALAALTAMLVPPPAAAQERVGVNAAVNTDANGLPPGGAIRKLVIGQEVVHNERITTDAKGQTQILFVDGSSISVGPNADLVIDEFVYDPATGTGKMTITAVQGAMRFVGGKLSKQDNAVTLHIGTATIGVRGGVFVADVQPGGKTEVIFVYGKAVKVAGQSGCSQELYRSGFAVDINGAGGCPDSPHQAPPGATVGILAQLDGRTGGTGGATTIPTDATVANSGVPNTVSNNVTTSVQQAMQNTPAAPAAPTPTVAPTQISTSQTQVAASQSQPVVVAAVQNTITPTPPAPPLQPVVIQIAGLAKVAPLGSTLGFTNQSAAARLPFTGSITYPAGSAGLQNGIATGSDAAGTVFTLSPLTAGTTTNVTATATTANNPATGTATESVDGDFFFSNLTATGSGQQIFAFGGTPVAQSFFAPKPNQQVFAFNVQPDATLGLNGQAQTIPFLPGTFGGTMMGAAASPLYMVTPANTQFGVNNTTTNPNAVGPKYLQATLAINGQSASQSSALVVTTGSFFTSSDTGMVAATGPVRGTIFTSATAPLTRIASGSATVPDANGNNLFGGTTIDGFVLDQNQFNVTDNFVPALATQQIFQSGSGLTSTNFAFNQPVTAATLPTGIGTNRSALNETGFFGGIMQCCSINAQTNAIINYAVLGETFVQTDPVSSRVAATFVGTDPFTSAQSGLNAIELNFGSLPNSGGDFARSTFIDNNIFAALESPTTASVINRQVGGQQLTTTLPLPTSGSNTNFAPQLAMVTSATVAGATNSLLAAAGATPCQCQYLQWGYWTGKVVSPATTTSGFAGATTNDVAQINTWIAGQPTVTMPTTGTANYNGAAVGTVFNNGASYLAAGSFSNRFNFGNNTGVVSISNFDGNSLSGTVAGSGNIYTGSITGSNKAGSVLGQFFGPGAVETGGAFAFHSTGGPNYLASGIFAGK